MAGERPGARTEGARVGVVLFGAGALPAIACSVLAGAPLPVAPLAIIGAVSTVVGLAASRASRAEDESGFDVSLSEMLGWGTDSEFCQVKSYPQPLNAARIEGTICQVKSYPQGAFDGVGNESVDPCIISDQHHSSIGQGTPNPPAPAGSTQQDRPQDSDRLTAHEPGRPVLRPLLELPPRPAHLPTIHLMSAERDSPQRGPVRAAASTNDPRSDLESKPLREAIAELGAMGYIEALDQLLSLARPGSEEILLTAIGPLRGLGARGLQNSDGTFGLTRADVLKMRRKARQQVAANLPGDLAMNGEGSSCFSNS